MEMRNGEEEGAEEGRGQGEEKRGGGGRAGNGPMPLMGLNHISRLCKSVEASIDFYTKLLGFVLVERPPAFESFTGAWLYNYGVGIHLVQKQEQGQRSHVDPSPEKLEPMDNHISFQCEDMEAIEERLKERKIEYLKRTVDGEEGSAVDQLFFKDPDGFMIEICNCENLKLVPAGPPGWIRPPRGRRSPPVL